MMSLMLKTCVCREELASGTPFVGESEPLSALAKGTS